MSTSGVVAHRHAPRLVAVVLALVLLAVGLTGCSSPRKPIDADHLATWNAAVAKRSTAPARWVALGDSISEGQGASSRSARWLDITLAGLRDRHPTPGVAGGEGYVPAQFAVYAPDSTWADWSTNSTGTIRPDFTVPSLGYRALTMEAGASKTYPFTGTGLDIWWARYAGSGDFTYSVDGGPSQTVTTDGPPTTGAITKVDDLASGSHQITITALAAFTLEGFTLYDGDRDKGIRLYDSAHSGATVATFTSDRAGFLTAMRRAAPSLITITLGGNDTKEHSPKQLESQYVSFLRVLRKLPTKPSVLVVGEFTPGPAMAKGLSAPWSEYLAAVERASAQAGAGYVGMADTFPRATTSGTGIYSTDGIHPNDRGQRRIAKLVLGTLADHEG